MALIQGTTVILVVLQRTIFLGADSLLHDINGRPTGTRCKIIQVNDSIAAIAGLLGDDDWDLAEIARLSLTSPAALDDRVNNFAERTAWFVNPLLTRMRTQEPGLYRQEVQNKPLIQAVFVERGQIRTITLEPVNSGVSGVILLPHKGRSDASCDQTYVALGHFDHLSPIVDHTPDFWKPGEVPAQIRELISIEMQAAPNQVGGPISLVRMDSRGIEWLARGTCI